MKTLFSDIIPKLQSFSKKLDNLSLLTNQQWVQIDNIESEKKLYYFKTNKELLISKNGIVEKGRWEYLSNKTLTIEYSGNTYLYKHVYFDENMLALKMDSKEEYTILINENKYDDDINSNTKVIEFLNKHYLNSNKIKLVENQTQINFHPPILTDLSRDESAINPKVHTKDEDIRIFTPISWILLAIFVMLLTYYLAL